MSTKEISAQGAGRLQLQLAFVFGGIAATLASAGIRELVGFSSESQFFLLIFYTPVIGILLLLSSFMYYVYPRGFHFQRTHWALTSSIVVCLLLFWGFLPERIPNSDEQFPGPLPFLWWVTLLIGIGCWIGLLVLAIRARWSRKREPALAEA